MRSSVDDEVVAQDGRLAELGHERPGELGERVGEQHDLCPGPQLVEELGRARQRRQLGDDLGDRRHAEPVALEQVEAVPHQDVVVGLVARRAAQLLDAGALGDGDPDLGQQDALDVECHQRGRSIITRAGVSAISVDDVGPSWPRQVVAHVGVHDELGAGDGAGGGDPSARLHEGIGEAVDDERRHPDSAEVPGAIAAGGDRQALAAGAVGSVAAVEGLLDHQLDGLRRRSADPDVRLNPYTPFVDGLARVLGDRLGQLAQQRPSWSGRACGRRCST